MRGNHHLLAASSLEGRSGHEGGRRRSGRTRTHGAEICSLLRCARYPVHNSPSKIADAKRLGADEVVLSNDADAMKKEANSFDFILDTVSAVHDLNSYLPLLKRDAAIARWACPISLPTIFMGNLIFKRRHLSGSIIGGMAETQEMLDYCADHNIVSDVEVIPIQQINDAFERVIKADVKYRFVIDMASLKKP